jgi:hypothetical protein
MEPPANHEFTLIHDPLTSPAPDFDSPIYDAIKATPPVGYEIRNVSGRFGLRCTRRASTKLVAIGEAVTEIFDRFGLFMNDANVEDLWEWTLDGKDGEGAGMLAQYLLMAVDRGKRLGYTVDDMVAFVRAVDVTKKV